MAALKELQTHAAQQFARPMVQNLLLLWNQYFDLVSIP
jgi:hypothetical protein